MNGQRQCRLQSTVGSEPPRCHDCYEPWRGVCQCDCSGCWDSRPAGGASEEDHISLGALGDIGRRGLSRCACRCVPNEQCVAGTFTYDPSYGWYCGRCRTENCTCNCPGCVRNGAVSPYGTSAKRILVIRSGETHQGTGRPEGQLSSEVHSVGLVAGFPLRGTSPE